MPVANIIDKRTNKYDVICQAIFESSWHDNVVAGATRFPTDEPADECLYFCIGRVTVGRAIEFAQEKWEIPVTLYLYDVTEDNHIDIREL